MKSNVKKKIVIILSILLISFVLITILPNQSKAANSNGDFVIVLDPGHGGGDPGAMGGSLREDQVNFKIAQYAKEELEQYEGVKVYLTRYNDNPSIYDRVEIAKSYNADLLVSIHINSGAGGSARGAAIWVTQDKTKVQYYQKASEAAQIMLNSISSLGIQNNGVQTRSGQPNEWYDSGVVQDYYGIIRYAQRVELRSLLVEHCYIDNAQDRTFIDSDSDLRRLAQADVRGIVEAYQLNKKSENKTQLKSISLKQPEVNLEITNENPNPTYFMPITYTPSNVSNKTVYWYTSNASVATVSGGTIYAKGQGEATITAISGNRQKLATCKVLVTKPSVPLQSISLKQENVTVKLGETGWIGATYNPNNASDKVLYWTSSNEKIAKIHEGVITPVSRGTATLTAISRAGGKVATCQVIVQDPDFVNLESITMKTEALDLKVGETGWVGVTYTPSNAGDKVLTWKSSNEKVATVSEGTVRAVGKGTAILTATSRDGGKTATCKVTVDDGTVSLESLSLKTTNLTMNKGEKATVYAVYNPSNVTDKVLYWSSSNTKVATVSEGVVTAVGNGTATITAKSRDGGKTATCKVTVGSGTVSLEKLTLKNNMEILTKGSTKTIYAVYNPSNVTDKVLYWKSSNENVAKVSEGNVTAVGNGVATITATSRDGGKTASCQIIVVDKNTQMTGITLKTTNMEMNKGEKAVIYATYNPSNVTDKVIYWVSSNENVAKVSEGNVTAVGKGTATITAITKDGGKKAVCEITVK